MENKTLESTMALAGNAMKLAANLTEPKKETPKEPKYIPEDQSNKATTGSQTVVVSMDGKKKEQKPVEKHIHTFPENRPLTTEECELDLKKAQMDFELAKTKEAYFQKQCDRNWEHMMEVEKKNERKGKIRRIIGGILVALGVGTVGYSIYTDYRDHKGQAVAPKALPEGNNIAAEGTVK